MVKEDENHIEMSTKILPTQLTNEEVQKRGEELAGLFEKIEELKGAKADDMKAWKDRIETAQMNAHQLATIITTGFEDRPVTCCTTFDYQRLSVTTSRTDTGEILDTRPMTEDERQRELPLHAKS